MRLLVVAPAIEQGAELAARLPAEIRVASSDEVDRALADLPDVVVLDCGAATSSITRTLKAEHPMLPIIALVGDAHRLEAIRAGVDHCLAAPLVAASIDELIARAERLVENSARHRSVRDQLTNLHEWHDWFRDLVHGLRNPVTVAACAVSLARENDLVNDDLREAERALEELASILRDTYDADRIRHGALVPRREPIDLASLAVDVSNRLPLAGSIDLSVDGDTSITVDPLLIGRVFGNLIADADRHAVRRPVQIRIAGSLQGVSAHITNDGPGIAPEIERHLFEPWRKHDATRCGVALAFCRFVCEAHAGKIWLDSGSEGSVTFAFGLPRL